MAKRSSHPVHYARELIVQYRQHPAKILIDSTQITTAAGAAAVVVPILRPQIQEVFLALHLDAKRRLLGIQEVARGGVTEVHVAVRLILTAALAEKNSVAIVLAHNHPSGDPNPSPDDVVLSQRHRKALELFEIELVDHIIVGDTSYCSFSETGRMRR